MRLCQDNLIEACNRTSVLICSQLCKYVLRPGSAKSNFYNILAILIELYQIEIRSCSHGNHHLIPSVYHDTSRTSSIW